MKRLPRGNHSISGLSLVLAYGAVLVARPHSSFVGRRRPGAEILNCWIAAPPIDRRGD